MNLNSLETLDLLTACIWAESRGEPMEGRTGVCNVVLNRVRKGMGLTIRAVILKPMQFSWTRPGNPNLVAVQEELQKPSISWANCHAIARRALAWELQDNTDYADHYLNVLATRAIRGGTLPKWANLSCITKVIGNHTFLRLQGR